jgi:hypothetical protein
VGALLEVDTRLHDVVCMRLSGRKLAQMLLFP